MGEVSLLKKQLRAVNFLVDSLRADAKPHEISASIVSSAKAAGKSKATPGPTKKPFKKPTKKSFKKPERQTKALSLDNKKVAKCKARLSRFEKKLVTAHDRKGSGCY